MASAQAKVCNPNLPEEATMLDLIHSFHGAAILETGPGGCAHRGLGAVLSSLVNRNYHVKHAKVAGTAVTTLLACLQSPASMHKSDYICFQQP